MQKILFKEKKIEEKGLEEKIPIKLNLEYYLVEEFSGKNKTYGIEIINKKSVNNHVYMDNKIYKDISMKKEYVKTLLSLLVDNIVTPISLYDILVDRLGI